MVNLDYFLKATSAMNEYIEEENETNNTKYFLTLKWEIGDSFIEIHNTTEEFEKKFVELFKTYGNFYFASGIDKLIVFMEREI